MHFLLKYVKVLVRFKNTLYICRMKKGILILGMIGALALIGCKKVDVKSPSNTGDSTKVETDTLEVQDSLTVVDSLN